MKFKVGSAVRKIDGYMFPGDIVAAFRTRAGKERYVVENSIAPGLLHIFSPEQLERVGEDED